MRIDVYDFDGTIYDGDSTVDLVLFSLRRHPTVWKSTPKILGAAIRLGIKKIGLTEFKSVLFGEMCCYFSLEDEARAFWQEMKTKKKLGPWFFERPRDLPIVIASASPEFELRYAAELLGVSALIGTRCDTKTGKLLDRNCKGAQKIERIQALFGEDVQVRAMYTDDTRADGPLLEIAEEQYLVTHGQVKRIKKTEQGGWTA